MTTMTAPIKFATAAQLIEVLQSTAKEQNFNLAETFVLGVGLDCYFTTVKLSVTTYLDGSVVREVNLY